MNRIWVLSVGWAEDALTLGAIRRLREAGHVLLRTAQLGCAEWLGREGISYRSLDALYDAAEDFDALNEAIARAVLDVARDTQSIGDVAYAVSDLSDRSVAKLIQLAPQALSYVTDARPEGELSAFVSGNVRVLPASDVGEFEPDVEVNTLITEIDSRVLASAVKLRLMDVYPDECEIRVLDNRDGPRVLPLCELDRLGAYNHRVAALIPAVSELTHMERYGFRQLNRIMRILRAPDGCPWDREQTHQSIRSNAIEEAYEVVDAIDRGDTTDLCEELGDLLLQVTLHGEIARQHGEFSISDVTTGVCKKLIHRHPHIFAGTRADTSDEVLAVWQQTKKKEKKQKTDAEAMRSIAGALPATMRAQKVLKRAAEAGLPAEFPSVPNAVSLSQGDEKAAGELMLWAVDAVRKAGVQPELALSAAVDRLIERFENAERG